MGGEGKELKTFELFWRNIKKGTGSGGGVKTNKRPASMGGTQHGEYVLPGKVPSS